MRRPGIRYGRILLAWAVCWVWTWGARADAPVVHIERPVGGYTSTRVLTIEGWIEGDPERAVLIVNGSERPLQMKPPEEDGGRPFSVSLLIPPGANTVVVEAENREGRGRDSVTFFANVPPLNLSVVLSWDTDGTDVDLHVIDPSGEECDYTNKETEAGGRLDVDDTDGFGPEIFTLANALAGTYRIFVHYFSDNGYPQTLATVDVILYEGTSAEKRYRYQAMLTRTGSRYEVGEFQVTPAVP